MAALRDGSERGVRNRGGELASVIGLHQSVVPAPNHERRDRDAPEAAEELWVVRVWFPDIERMGAAIFDHACKRLFGKRACIDFKFLWIAEQQGHQLLLVDREDIGNVGGFAIAHLD